MTAIIASFVLAFLFTIVEAMPLKRRGNSTVSTGFDRPTEFGPWTVPYWAYILIIGLIVTTSISLLAWLVKFLISVSCWTLVASVDTLLADTTEQRQEQQAPKTQHHHHQQQQQQQKHQLHPAYRSFTNGTHTRVHDPPHIRTYSTHSNGGPYTMNQAGAGNIAPYHQYTLPGALSNQHQPLNQKQEQELKGTGPGAFQLTFIPTSTLPPKPPPSLSHASSRPSAELDPGPYPPPGLEHKYRASH